MIAAAIKRQAYGQNFRRCISCYYYVLPHTHSFHVSRVKFLTTNAEKNPMKVDDMKKAHDAAPTHFEIIKNLASNLWKKDDPGMRARVVFSLGLLVGAKVVNVQVPFLFKEAIDTLNIVTSSSINTPLMVVPMAALLGYGIARSTSSLFNEVRTAVFAKVAHTSIQSVALDAFKHLHNLDLQFHLNRSTGELSKTIDRGTRAINYVLRAIVFNVAPTLVEIGLVASLLGVKCGMEFAGVTTATIIAYCVFTIGITQWRSQFRRDMNRLESKAHSRAVDSLLNYETVKYFGNEDLEAKRYGECLTGFQTAALKTSTSLSLLNFGQNVIFSVGLTTMMILAAQKVILHELSVGDLVMVHGLLFQLSVPLNFVGSVYRDVHQSLIDLETMLSLRRQTSSVQNVSKCGELRPFGGQIQFRNVSFSFNDSGGKQPIFDNLSFSVEAGKTVAFVGNSGAGKSTLLRLLYRFYDPESGEIFIDGQNIRLHSLSSVRKCIGVVPQDTVLFNDTVQYNIAYGDPNACQKSIIDVAKKAQIHETVMKLPQQYKSIVGERGLKLSGGEKQRIAIARMMLKNPQIVFCDEATSALDSHTEQEILSSLKNLTRHRTSIFIAHRLSTVVDVDEIFVLDQGRIVEQGSHARLMRQRNGAYRRLWLRQQQTNVNT